MLLHTFLTSLQCCHAPQKDVSKSGSTAVRLYQVQITPPYTHIKEPEASSLIPVLSEAVSGGSWEVSLYRGTSHVLLYNTWADLGILEQAWS